MNVSTCFAPFVPLLSFPENWQLKTSSSDDESAAVDRDEKEWMARNEHWHLHREIMLVVSGISYQNINNRFFAGKPGDLFMMERREKHPGGFSPKSRGAQFWIYVLPNFCVCKFYIRGNKTGAFQLHHHYIFPQMDMVNQLHKSWNQLKTSRDNMPVTVNRFKALLFIIITEAIQHMSESGEYTFFNSMMQQRKRIEVAKKYIEDSCGRGASIDSLARLSGYSRQHFMRMFKEIIGVKAGEYINSIRAMKYFELEEAGEMKKVIADELGFGSTAALRHWVVRRMKRTALRLVVYHPPEPPDNKESREPVDAGLET